MYVLRGTVQIIMIYSFMSNLDVYTTVQRPKGKDIVSWKQLI